MGIGMGIFATLVYALTMESTTSLWDCGEFIAASYKQQVVHPPGAPLFLMIGRMFTLIPDLLGKTEWISLSMNFMSALSSGLAIMLLFWITTHFMRKVFVKTGERVTDAGHMWAILGAGLIGSLSGTFLDTVWFSAVEAEVYSMALFCTALVFWLTCKWERNADDPYADRYLVLIAFILGCSIFIHWLSLLCIPALMLTYYFKRHKATVLGTIGTLALSGLVLILFLNGVITGAVDFIAAVEKMVVNNMGMPFNTGVYLGIVIIVVVLTAGLFLLRKLNKPVAFNGLLALVFVLIGYSTIASVPIRSNAFTPIDMNSPRDIVSLSSYLHRDQYGSRPLATGYYYYERPTGVEYTGKRYAKNEKKGIYDVVGEKFEYTYNQNADKIIFPRLHSSAPQHISLYKQWLGLKKTEKPTYGDNLRFFFKYQIGHMYLRYFAWNFIGRQNDAQGTVTARDGNWISGVPFLENPRAPKQTGLPKSMKNHPYRNTFYFIPFLLGLLGMIFHFMNDKKSFLILLMLFLMTGVVLIIYGNSPPIEPRERDYIFAASFWAFCIWLGAGVVALFSLFNFLKGPARAGLAVGVALIAPILMGFQGWDEHDRSDRYAARDYAINYLESCAPNAILFTQGDNDTYPLWYAQEVEGVRKDVHVVNLSLLGVDWYINQKRHKVNDAAAVPMIQQPEDIRGSERDMVLYNESPSIAPQDRYVNLVQIMEFIANESNQRRSQSGDQISYYPTKKFSLPIPSAEKLVANGTVDPEDQALVAQEINWTLPKDRLLKNDLMVLDIIAANAKDDWSRPIYFAVSVDRNSYMGLNDYFQLEGLAYRLVPIKNNEADRSAPFIGRVNTDKMYDNLMNKFKFGNIDKDGVFMSTDVGRMASNFRSNFVHLAETMINQGNKEQAVQVLDKARAVFKDKANNNLGLFSYRMPIAYYLAGAPEKGNEMADQIIGNLMDEIEYYQTMSDSDLKRQGLGSTMGTYLNVVNQILSVARSEGQKDFADRMEQTYGLK